MPPDTLAHRQWLTSHVSLDTTALLVDLGCGAGHDLALLAERAGPQVRFVGIDRSSGKLEEAKGRFHNDPRARFIELDLNGSLPFATGSADIVYSNNVLECFPDKQALLREVHRILRPEGQVVFAHWDWESQAFDAPDRDLVRRVIRAFADWRQSWMDDVDGWMGRRLWSTFQQTKLFEGSVSARILINTVYAEPFFCHALISEVDSLVAAGFLSFCDYNRIRNHVEALAARKEFFYSITGYVYVGKATTSIESKMSRD